MTDVASTLKLGVRFNRAFHRLGVAIFLCLLMGATGLGTLHALAQQPPTDWLRKWPDRYHVAPGELLTYTIVYSNPTANVVTPTLEDMLPPQAILVSADPRVLSTTANPLVWNLGPLLPGQLRQVRVVVQLKRDVALNTVMTNVAKLRQSDTSLAYFQAYNLITTTPSLPPLPEATLLFQKRANITSVNLGGQIEYALLVTNTSNVTAFEVLVQDPVPSMTTYLADSAVASTGVISYVAEANQIRWLGGLAPQQAARLTFKVTVGTPSPSPTQVCIAAGIGNRAYLMYRQQKMVAENFVGFNCPKPEGEPGVIGIQKVAPVNVMALKPGDSIQYTVIISHEGGTAPFATVMNDVLPSALEFVSGPKVTELVPSAGPLGGRFEAGQGSSGTISWRGVLSPNATIQIEYVARIRRFDRCPADQQIRNVAKVMRPDGKFAESAANIGVQCNPEPEQPKIRLYKQLKHYHASDDHENDADLTGSAEVTTPITEAEILGSEQLAYILTLVNDEAISRTVQISDTMPRGIEAVGIRANQGTAIITDNGRVIAWRGTVNQASRPVEIVITVKLTERVACGERLVNVAHWFTEARHGDSNPVVISHACDDLGDAPDSTNHAGVPMTAYPGVPAHFPTVFDSTPERGPVHLQPRPMHLGRGVSLELGADIGFDSDGHNNLEPSHDKANLDERDDGVDLGALKLAHCNAAQIPVSVSLEPRITATLTATNGLAYLNVWLDSNRDGDWADSFECPNGKAVEHIVIDYPVNVNTLGVGFHKLNVPTSGAVAWPETLLTKPSWLRVTLSDRPANKNLGGYGDGRGYEQPFMLGETEDYLLRFREASGDADLTIRKKGELVMGHPEPKMGDGNQNATWEAHWAIEYGNMGITRATNVQIIDQLNGPQTLRHNIARPMMTPTIEGGKVTYNVGELKPGQRGFIGLNTEIPLNTPPGTVLVNQVEIRADKDANTTNNTAVYSLTVPLLPPLILSPVPGTTCNGALTVVGKAQPNVMVQLFVDGTGVQTITTNDAGQWQTELTLSEGKHELYARSAFNGKTSPASKLVMVVVDKNLVWSPLSLRFMDAQGHVTTPRNHEGYLTETGWQIFLRRNQLYTVTVLVCCDDLNAQVSLEISGVGSINLADSGQVDKHGYRIFAATFSTPDSGQFEGAITLCVTCNSVQRCADGKVSINPQGGVFDRQTGKPLAEAEVTCLVAQPDEEGRPHFARWPAESFGQVNPQMTVADGLYHFAPPSGTYQLQVQRQGYQPYRSPRLVVVDGPLQHNIYLMPEPKRPVSHTVVIGENGFDPPVLQVEPGQVIEWLNLGGDSHAVQESSSTEPQGRQATQSWASGVLSNGEAFTLQFDTAGVYSYYDPENPANTATIIVGNQSNVTLTKTYLPLIRK